MHRTLGRGLVTSLMAIGAALGWMATTASGATAPATARRLPPPGTSAVAGRPAAAPLAAYKVVTVQNVYSGLCLDDYGFSQANDTAIVQHDCNGYANQQWVDWAYPDSGVFVQNSYSGEYLDDYGFSTANDTVIRQYHFDGYANRQWNIEVQPA